MRKNCFAVSTAVVVLAWSAVTAAAATDWHLLAATLTSTPRSALEALEAGGAGTLQLAPSESATFYAGGNEVAAALYLAAPAEAPGPARVTLSEGGDLVVIESGRAVFYSRVPLGEQLIEVALARPGQAGGFRAPLPPGRLVIDATGAETYFGFEPAAGMAAEPWPPDVARPFPPNAWLRLLPNGTVNVASPSLPSAIALDLAYIAQEIGLAAARQQRLLLQQDLVLKLARYEPSLQKAYVQVIAPPYEVRVVQTTAQTMVNVPVSQAPSAAGVAVASSYGSVRNPGSISPAAIAAGPVSRGLAPASTFGGQGLGTGGLGVLGVRSYNSAAGVITFGPGALVSPGVRP